MATRNGSSNGNGRSGRNSARKRASAAAPQVNLALQGGGSHGAFTWGVIDRLLDEDGLDFAGRATRAFKLADRNRQRRLRNSQRIRCRSERTLLHQTKQIGDLPQAHFHPHRRRPSSLIFSIAT